ncbi:CHASE2 domain-containing protein [Collimonas silvisoli]|uniref:CHASE2 domain-containing protein n=1 Tax=Collimonas silvisoli TaxID=2825884 RepID=UPI001B8C2B6F|nr:CHASE2 domain-containing protein [Collimonas silvisoli]
MLTWLPRELLRAKDHRFLREWLLLGCAGAVFIIVLVAYHLTDSASNLVYDWLLQHQSRPPSTDIVIVTIDNSSLAQLGRWPWSRLHHAEALRRIAAGSPRAVMYNVLFTEPSAEDAVLAQAMSLAPVYLPMVVESGQTNPHSGHGLLPVEPLRAVAAGIGHINLETDRDGIVRNIALFEGNSQRLWPQFTLPAYWAERGRQAPLPMAAPTGQAEPAPSTFPPLLRVNGMLIPFSDPDASYAHVSFIDVLRGRVPSDFFHNKFVLVGATADGLLEHVTTAVSSHNGSMAGIDIHANILDALLSGRYIEHFACWPTVLYSLLPLALLFTGFLFLTPSQSILLLLTLMFATLGASSMLLLYGDIWIMPVPALITLVAIYPLWSWRRLEVAMSFIGAELEQLAEEPQLVQNRRNTAISSAGQELERNISLIREAAQQVRDLKRFVWDSLNSLPDPVLVADRSGYVRLVNQPARDCLAAPSGGELEGCTLPELLCTLKFVRFIGSESGLERCLQWPYLLDPSRIEDTAVMEQGVEVQSAAGQQYVLKYARCMSMTGDLIGWIANLSDVTILHAAQSQRDEMLHLLSHDMRSPQASIVALIELERPGPDFPSVNLAFDRIERYARRALALADSFVQLAAAETQDYAFEVVNFADILNSAVDEVWPLANARKIQLACDIADSEFLIKAECSMIARALVNLLNNAIKYSPPHTHIECLLSINKGLPDQVECVIRDQGYGIAHEHKMRLFERFHRFRSVGQPYSDGVGLGLTFVKTVVVRHGGSIHCESAPGHGTTMTMRLPLAASVKLSYQNPAALTGT